MFQAPPPCEYLSSPVQKPKLTWRQWYADFLVYGEASGWTNGQQPDARLCYCRRGRHLNTAAVVVTQCIGCTAQLYITELRLTTAPAHRTATRHRGLGHSARRPTGRPDLGPGHVPRAAGNRRRLHQSQAGAVTGSRRAGTAAGRPPRPAGRQQPNTRGGRRHPLHSSSLQLQSPSPHSSSLKWKPWGPETTRHSKVTST